jgi:hypothetical protein
MLDNLQRVLIEVTNRGGQHEVRSSLVGRQRGLRALTVGAENLCHLCRPVLWTPAPRSRGWQVLAWPDVRPDVTQELHGRLKRKPARMLTFPTPAHSPEETAMPEDIQNWAADTGGSSR